MCSDTLQFKKASYLLGFLTWHFLTNVAGGLWCMAEISIHPERLLREPIDVSVQVSVSSISCLTHLII